MLLALKNYMQVKELAHLSEISKALNVDPAVAKRLMNHWLRKGVAIKGSRSTCGVACARCTSERYEWIG